MIKKAVLLSAAGFLCASIASAQTEPTVPAKPDIWAKFFADTKIEAEDLGSLFSVEYKITDTNRKQKLYFRKVADSYRSLEGAEVFGLVWESDKAPTTEFLQKTFDKRFSMGGLVYELPSENQKMYRIRYHYTIDPQSNSKTLIKTLQILAATADSLELTISGKEDRF